MRSLKNPWQVWVMKCQLNEYSLTKYKGVGEEHKVEWIRKLKIQHNISYIGVQETQVNSRDSIEIEGCWGGPIFEFELVDSIGRFGGLLCIWDQQLFSKSFSTKSKFFLAIGGTWKGIVGDVIIFGLCV